MLVRNVWRKVKAPVKAPAVNRRHRRGEVKCAHCVVQVKVTQSTEAHKLPQIINTLQKGDYFGEKALIR